MTFYVLHRAVRDVFVGGLDGPSFFGISMGVTGIVIAALGLVLQVCVYVVLYLDSSAVFIAAFYLQLLFFHAYLIHHGLTTYDFVMNRLNPERHRPVVPPSPIRSKSPPASLEQPPKSNARTPVDPPATSHSNVFVSHESDADAVGEGVGSATMDIETGFRRLRPPKPDQHPPSIHPPIADLSGASFELPRAQPGFTAPTPPSLTSVTSSIADKPASADVTPASSADTAIAGSPVPPLPVYTTTSGSSSESKGASSKGASASTAHSDVAIDSSGSSSNVQSTIVALTSMRSSRHDAEMTTEPDVAASNIIPLPSLAEEVGVDIAPESESIDVRTSAVVADCSTGQHASPDSAESEERCSEGRTLAASIATGALQSASPRRDFLGPDVKHFNVKEEDEII